VISFPSAQAYSIEKRTDTPMFAKMTNQVSLPDNLRIEITGQYFSGRNIGQGRELSRGGIDLGLKKSFAGNRLEMNLSATDIINTLGIRQEIEGQGFSVKYENYYETQVFSLNCKYKF